MIAKKNKILILLDGSEDSEKSLGEALFKSESEVLKQAVKFVKIKINKYLLKLLYLIGYA